MKGLWGFRFPFFVLIAFSGKTPINAESCDKYVTMLQSFPDGYRAELLMPVLDKATTWKAEISFDKPITTFDTAKGNLEGGKKTGTQFNVTNYRHNGALKSGSTFRLEFIVHYPRNIVPSPKVQKIKFGRFSCQPTESGQETGDCALKEELPTCEASMKKNTQWPDGFSAQLRLPVKKSVQSWTLLLVFNKPIFVLNFPHGQIVSRKNNTEFTIKSRDYNGKHKEGATANFDFSIHYQRGQMGTSLAAVIFDPAQYACVATAYKETISERYRKTLSKQNENAIIGADWLVDCKNTLPECSKMFRVRDIWPDGVRGFLSIPVQETVPDWNVTLFFNQKITTLDVNQGDKVLSREGVLFVVRNHSYNARKSAGSIFDFEVTTHFPRDKSPRPRITIAKFRNKIICEDVDDDCVD